MPLVSKVRRRVKDPVGERWWGDPIFFQFLSSLQESESKRVEECIENYFPTVKNVAASYYSTRKYDRPQPVLNEDVWALAHDFTVRHFAPAMSGAELTDAPSYAWTLRPWTTPGFPLNEVWPSKGTALQDVRFWDFFGQYMDADFAWDVLWGSTVKSDELRPPEKIELNELRTFLSGPLHHALGCGVMFGDMNSKLYSSKITWSTIGRSTFMKEWHEIMSRLPHKDCFGTDLSNQDASMCQRAMLEQAEIRFSMLARDLQTERNHRRCVNLYRQIVFSFLVLAKGEVVQKDTGNPSGSVNTIGDNTMLNFKFMAYTWLMLWLEEYGQRLPDFILSPEASYVFYVSNVSANLIGDDAEWSVSSVAQRVWQPDRIKRFLASIFIIIKFEFSEPKLIHELEYCSHSTKIFFGQYVPVMDFERGVASLAWKGHLIDYEPGVKRIGFQPHYALRRALDIRREGFWNDELFSIADRYSRWIMTEHAQLLHKPAPGGPLAGITLSELLSSYMPEGSIRSLYTMREGSEKQSKLEAPAANPVGAFKKVECVSSTLFISSNFMLDAGPSAGLASKFATGLLNRAAPVVGAVGRKVADAVTNTIGNPFEAHHRVAHERNTRERQERLQKEARSLENLRARTRAVAEKVGQIERASGLLDRKATRGTIGGIKTDSQTKGISKDKMPPKGSLKKAVHKEVKKEMKKKVSFKGRSKKGRKSKKGRSKKGKKGYQLKTGRNNKYGVGASYFSFQHAQFKGEDLWVPLELNGNDGSHLSLGSDVNGTIIIQQKISPTNWIPNSRAQRLVSLFEEVKFIELWVGFKSSMAPGNVGGKLRIFYEADMDDVLPANYATPAGSALSNWLIHPGKTWDIAHKGTQWFKVPVHLCKGPMGGWFFVDSVGVHTDAERYGGQVAIAIEEQWNTVGSSGQIPAAGLSSVGNLLIKYTIGVQTAAEEDISAGGANRLVFLNQTVAAFAYARPTNSNTVLYPTQTNLTQNNAVLIQAARPASGNAWAAYAGSAVNISFPMYVMNTAAGDVFFFAEPGIYYVTMFVNTYVSSDFAATGANDSGLGSFVHVGSGPGSVGDQDYLTAVSGLAHANAGPFSSAWVSVIDPFNDGFRTNWQTGTGGSATFGGGVGGNAIQFNAFQAAPTIVPALRKMSLEKRRDFVEQHLAKMLGRPARNWRSPAEMKSSVRDEILQVLSSSPEQFRELLRLREQKDGLSLSLTPADETEARVTTMSEIDEKEAAARAAQRASEAPQVEALRAELALLKQKDEERWLKLRPGREREPARASSLKA